jgi:hypothetical protein
MPRTQAARGPVSDSRGCELGTVGMAVTHRSHLRHRAFRNGAPAVPEQTVANLRRAPYCARSIGVALTEKRFGAPHDRQRVESQCRRPQAAFNIFLGCAVKPPDWLERHRIRGWMAERIGCHRIWKLPSGVAPEDARSALPSRCSAGIDIRVRAVDATRPASASNAHRPTASSWAQARGRRTPPLPGSTSTAPGRRRAQPHRLTLTFLPAWVS